MRPCQADGLHCIVVGSSFASPATPVRYRTLSMLHEGICAAQLNWFSPFNTTEPLADYNIVDALGYGGGSILFAVGAGLLLSRQVTCVPRHVDTAPCPDRLTSIG